MVPISRNIFLKTQSKKPKNSKFGGNSETNTLNSLKNTCWTRKKQARLTC